MAEPFFPPSPLGATDAGAEPRVDPCPVRTWCVKTAGHEGRCELVHRTPPRVYDGPARVTITRQEP